MIRSMREVSITNKFANSLANLFIHHYSGRKKDVYLKILSFCSCCSIDNFKDIIK